MGKGKFISNHGRYLNTSKKQNGAKAKKPLGAKKIALIVIAVILVLVLGVAIAGVSYYNYILNKVPRAEFTENEEMTPEQLAELLGITVEEWYRLQEEAATETTEATEATTEATEVETESTVADYGKTGKIVNIMVVGQNYREGEWSKLSDTMILVTINKETKTMTLTSFLRDTYVQLPNYKTHTCGKNRINVAYNLGWQWGGDAGAFEMLDTCIYNNFGAEIDYNIEINFDGFVELIDLLGGVTVELNEDEAAYMTDCAEVLGNFAVDSYEAGSATLDGNAALAYARMRHSSATDNDINRASRQRDLIGSILNQVRNQSLIELNNLIQAALPYILTDMTNDDITTLALELLPLLPELTMVSNQCPAETEGSYWGEVITLYGADAGVIVPNLQLNRELLTAITEGTETEE